MPWVLSTAGNYMLYCSLSCVKFGATVPQLSERAPVVFQDPRKSAIGFPGPYLLSHRIPPSRPPSSPISSQYLSTTDPQTIFQDAAVLWALLVSIKDYRVFGASTRRHVDAENVSDYLQSTDTDHHIISRPNSPFGENAPFQQGSLPQLHSEPETITADDPGSVNESDSPDPESSELADYTHILDQQIVAEHRRRASELAGIRRRGRFRALAASHVLLAACKPREKAMGGRDGGILTKLWLHFMKYGNVRPYTYAQLVKHINEGIEGINKSLKRAGVPYCWISILNAKA
ncbi:hypothetical protein BC629DRAFT_1594901 [Irpex lacteus]|nr:hypothetical protein BC629DRAFT_1594901 [Irpex lacteus]